MHPHHSSTSSSSLSSVRDRERQREREQRRVLAQQSGQNQINNSSTTEKSILFPVEAVRLEQEDNTSKEIKSTLGEFGKLMPFLTNNSLNYSADFNANLVGISRNEVNRRRVNEIVAEMKQNLPTTPITGLDDLIKNNNEFSTSNLSTTNQQHSNKSQAPSSTNRFIESNTQMQQCNNFNLQSMMPNYSNKPNASLQSNASKQKMEIEGKNDCNNKSSSSEDDSSSESGNNDDDDDDDDDSSGDSESSDVSGSGDDSNNSDSEQKAIENNKQNEKYNQEEVDVHVKLKNYHNNLVTSFPNGNTLNNDEDEEHKWDLDNFLPSGTTGFSQQEINSTNNNNNDTQTSKYLNKNQDLINKNKLLNSDEKSNKQNSKIGKNDRKMNTSTLLPNTNKLQQSTNMANLSKQMKSTTANKLKCSKTLSEDSDSDSQNSEHIHLNSNSDNCDSNDSTKKKQYEKQQTNYDEMEEGELDDDDNNNNYSDDIDDEARLNVPSRTALFSKMNDFNLNNKSFLEVNNTATQAKVNSTNKLNNNNNNNRKKAPPFPVIQPPSKFDDISSCATSKIKNKNRFANDENSWKDIKRRKDPSSTKSSANLINNSSHQIKSETESKNLQTNRLIATNTTIKNSSPTSKRKFKSEIALLDSNNRKNDLTINQPLSNAAANTDQSIQPLIVSIDLLKLNRIPLVNSDSAATIKTNLAAKKTKEYKCSSSNQKQDIKYLNSKSTSLPSTTTKTMTNKAEMVSSPSTSSKLKNEIETANRHNLSKHLPNASAHQLNASSPQTSNSLPVTIPLSNSINLTSPNHQTVNLNNQHRSPLCHNEHEAQSMARTLKRKADLIKAPQQQFLQYIEASMYFIQAGLIMEQKAEADKAYHLYRETLGLIKLTTSKLSKNRPPNPNEQNLIDFKLTILSYRCQALINSRLTKMRMREINENKEMIGQFFKANEQILGNPSSSLPSGNNSSPTIPVEHSMISLIRRQLILLQSALSANEIWNKLESMIETNSDVKEFFQQVDQESGAVLHLSSSMELLIHNTLKGVKNLQAILSV